MSVSRFWGIVPTEFFQIGPLKYLKQLPEYGELILASAAACHGKLVGILRDSNCDFQSRLYRWWILIAKAESSLQKLKLRKTVLLVHSYCIVWYVSSFIGLHSLLLPIPL
jgi:hypothetical protein